MLSLKSKTLNSNSNYLRNKDCEKIDYPYKKIHRSDKLQNIENQFIERPTKRPGAVYHYKKIITLK